jgi:pantoate--beta-alanine ligase
VNVSRTTVDLRTALAPDRVPNRSIGFVPTMGALHDGHLSLVRLARAECDVVVMSIFVNPLQFGPSEDLDRYPRDEQADLRLAEEAGVDLVFLPAVEEMYPKGADTRVVAGELATVAEGASRPSHFDGVATVVVKLLNIVQPTRAFFGQKDAQQVAVVKQVVRDLSLPVEIVVGDTVRDQTGLALSSRNVYLGEGERRAATSLVRAMRAGAEALQDTGDPSVAEKVMIDVIVEGGLELDYALVVDPDSFGEPQPDRDSLLVVAARAGKTRLIDNMTVTRGGDS